MARRWNTARQRSGKTASRYNVYGDPLGMDRPWNLDAIPLLISPHEWRELEAGLIQRARLLNWILADIYGPQKLLRGGHLPPATGVRQSRILAAVPRAAGAGNVHLHLLAVDLARSADGQWWVLSDRTQAPSGAGYALENRIVLAETFPDLFREFQVQRLASFFRCVSATTCCGLSHFDAQQSAGRAADARAAQRDLLRTLLPGALSGFHAGAGRRPDGARQPGVPEDAGRTQAGGRDPAPRGWRLLRSDRTAFRFVPGSGGTGGSGTRGQCGNRECAGQRPD